MNSNYVDQHSWGEVRRHRCCPRHRGGGHNAWYRNTSGRTCGCGCQGEPSEDSDCPSVAGLQDSWQEDSDQSGSGGRAEERKRVRPADRRRHHRGFRAEKLSGS